MKSRTLVLATLALVGCGGHHHHSSGGSTTNLSFAGSYTGTFAESAPNANALTGSLNLTIARDGTITGTAQSSQYTNPGTIVSGSKVDASGNVTLNFSYPNDGTTERSTLGGPLTLGTGTAQPGTLAPNTLNGTLTTTVQGTTTSFSTSLTQIVG